jgi:two-component system phosphate regulon sensor histidine kinase PhoR
MFRRRLFAKLFLGYSLVILLCMASVGWYLASTGRNAARHQIEVNLQRMAKLIDERLVTEFAGRNSPDLQPLVHTLGEMSEARITVIDPTGVVLADTDSDPKHMENHRFRPEVEEALAGRVGASLRFSSTVGENFLYVGVPANFVQGGAVRVAIPLSQFEKRVRATQNVLITGTTVAAVLALLLGLLFTRRITRPLSAIRSKLEGIERGDLDVRLEVDTQDEVGELAQALNRAHEQLSSTIQSLRGQHQQREAILASMVEGLLAVDEDDRILVVNTAARQILQIGLTSVEGRPLMQVIRSPGLIRFVQRVRQAESPRTAEVSLTQPSQRWLELHGAPLRVAGQAQGAVVVLNDVTRLRSLEQSRKDFVANVSHELRTPITSIQGFLETLLEGGALEDTESARRFLGIVSKQTNRLSVILDDLLYLSRMESENVEIPKGNVNLGLLATSCVGNAEQLARAKNISMDLKIDAQPLQVYGNVNLLSRMIDNLIENAIKYSPEGSRIEVHLQEADDRALLSVQDHGIGIPAEHLPRISERFYRVDTARSREMGGTGLGLAIVKHVALVHGGLLEVSSVLGQGSRFSIRLPLHTANGPDTGRSGEPALDEDAEPSA